MLMLLQMDQKFAILFVMTQDIKKPQTISHSPRVSVARCTIMLLSVRSIIPKCPWRMIILWHLVFSAVIWIVKYISHLFMHVVMMNIDPLDCISSSDVSLQPVTPVMMNVTWLNKTTQLSLFPLVAHLIQRQTVAHTCGVVNQSVT